MIINEQLKFNHTMDYFTYHGLIQLYKVTDTNAKIKPVSDPDGDLRCVVAASAKNKLLSVLKFS